MQTYPTGYAESHHIAEQIFREILPRHGMAVREEQIALCHEVLDTLYNKEISLCEAGVGTGKTLAYLVGCILWQMHRPERMKLPIVISTSSVALQDAILTEYLPDLSAILLDEGIITAPITAVVRKGKERFVCDARLAERASLVHPKRTREKSSLRIAENILDMDHIPELSRYDRCRICVPQSCPRDCFMRLDCRYQQYLRDSMKPDIQICNHNYLLADASHRLEDRPLLLRSYQALVVDEAHKLPDAARQMYTETLSPHNMDELCLLLQQAHYKDFARQLRTTFLTLSFSCTQGFSKLRRKVSEPFVLTPFRRAALIDCIALLQNAGGLPDVPRYLLNRLGEAESLLRLFLLEVPTRILYIDYDADGQPTFCAASSRVPQLLRSALWNTREPAILTSGTLAAAGDFSHTEQLLGLAAYRPLRHFRADSPFDYKKKCLLYFPPCVKTRMDNRKMAEEIVRLVGACHGHALVLFTSYRQMAEVRALTDGQWQYPTYQAWRNGGRVIQQFKESGNGVLFAAGSCWEGIDFPGDMVSHWGLVNSWAAFVLPSISTPFMIMLFRQASRSFPNDIIEAARLDGLSEIGIFFRMFVPIMRSTYGVAMTVTFMNAWNSYLWPKIVFQSNASITMPMLVANLKSGYSVDYGMLMLGVLICTLPTAIIFLCLQKSFANGITGAVK